MVTSWLSKATRSRGFMIASDAVLPVASLIREQPDDSVAAAQMRRAATALQKADLLANALIVNCQCHGILPPLEFAAVIPDGGDLD